MFDFFFLKDYKCCIRVVYVQWERYFCSGGECGGFFVVVYFDDVLVGFLGGCGYVVIVEVY